MYCSYGNKMVILEKPRQQISHFAVCKGLVWLVVVMFLEMGG